MNTQATIERLVQSSNIPVSFHGDKTLYGVNLFLMTAATYVTAMLVIKLCRDVISNRTWDKLGHPVSIYRFAWMCAGIAGFIRSFGEAAALWSWDKDDPATYSYVQLIKRITDPIALCFVAIWIILVVLSYDAMVSQLRRPPVPLNMWRRLSDLKRPALVVLISLGMAYGVMVTRG